jgi:hypothetical protein
MLRTNTEHSHDSLFVFAEVLLRRNDGKIYWPTFQ